VKIPGRFRLGFYIRADGAICGKSSVDRWGDALPGDVDLQSHTHPTMDPVATKSSFLCMYMSSHKDTLASYVIHHGKVTDTKIANAEMTRIDSKVPVHSRALHSHAVSPHPVCAGHGHQLPNFIFR
jgi:hypothetical protein